jgi:hypothetical protein
MEPLEGDCGIRLTFPARISDGELTTFGGLLLQWATAGMVITPAETGGLKEAPVPAPGTPAGIGQAAG